MGETALGMMFTAYTCSSFTTANSARAAVAQARSLASPSKRLMRKRYAFVRVWGLAWHQLR